MTWAVAHGQRLVADLHRVAVVQPARGREVLRGRKAKHRALLRQAIDPELIARMWPDDGQLQSLGQLARAAGVVDVRVREPDLAEREPQALDFCQQVEIAARVDDGGLAGGIAPDDGTVLLEGRDGNGEVAQHGDGKQGLQDAG